jgi:signal transduction histidine kinase
MMQQLRRFTGDASHELRTPLTTIKTNTGVALAEIQPSQEHIHALRQIDKAADRMTGVIDDLLLLARSDAGQMTESRQNVPVLELVQEAIEILKPTMSGRELDISGCSAQVTVSGAPTHLVRLFQNLLENASRYSPEARPIIVTARENGKNVLIQFIDGGPGVETEHLCHLGERFYRADTGRSRQQGGVGLGLAICKSIVSAHGGEIRFASAPGSGLTVSVVLPTS